MGKKILLISVSTIPMKRSVLNAFLDSNYITMHVLDRIHIKTVNKWNFKQKGFVYYVRKAINMTRPRTNVFRYQTCLARTVLFIQRLIKRNNVICVMTIIIWIPNPIVFTMMPK